MPALFSRIRIVAKAHYKLLSLVVAVAILASGCSKPAPLSIEQLRSRNHATSLEFVRDLDDGPAFSAYLMSYQTAGLNVHVMIAVPDQPAPRAGFPVVIANHGEVPDPARYGISADGTDSRPGDYYRSVPELYTSRGFIVVMPDYRGHNDSDGIEYTKGKGAVAYYAEDVLALLAALADVEQADLDNVFMWSHSMGGPVSMRVLLATDVIKGATFWSTMNVDDLQEYFGDLEPPLMIQHSVGDQRAPVANSKGLADALRSVDHPYVFHSYRGADHYFEGETRERAADRDAEFFRSLLRED